MRASALLIVDVQHGFLNEHTDHLPALIERLLPRYDHLIVTRFFNGPASNYRRLLAWESCERASEDFALAFSPPSNALMVDKPTYGCMTPAVLRYLARHGITDVHLAGMDTDACVYKTALDLFDRGLAPFVLAGHCASSGGPAPHDMALRLLARNIGASQILPGAP